MKTISTLLLAIVLAFTLSACATTGTGGAKVKCPACGYEFTTATD